MLVSAPTASATVLAPRAAAGNPFAVAITALFRASRSIDFWLLTLSFAICGLSTNGLINTHLIAYCGDHGIPEVSGGEHAGGDRRVQPDWLRQRPAGCATASTRAFCCSGITVCAGSPWP